MNLKYKKKNNITNTEVTNKRFVGEVVVGKLANMKV